MRVLPDNRKEASEFDAAGRLAFTRWTPQAQACEGTNPCLRISEIYDEASRRFRREITPLNFDAVRSARYGGTTYQEWVYDGLDRVLEATDDNGDGTNATRYNQAVGKRK